MRRLLIRSLLVGAIGVVVGSSAGCAEQRPSINQVQPNAMSKEFFVGKDLVSTEDDPEFWAQGTVVDVGYGAVVFA